MKTVALILLIVMLTACANGEINATTDKADPSAPAEQANEVKREESEKSQIIFDVTSLVGLKREEVFTLLGEPASIDKGNWLITKNREQTGEKTPYELFIYDKMEVMVIDNTAARVTIYPDPNLFKRSDPKPILPAIGLEYDWFYLENPNNIVWSQLHQVSQVTASSDSVDSDKVTKLNIVLEERFW